MEHVSRLIKMYQYKASMTSEESDALLAELMSCYLNKKPSTLMDLLIEDEIDGFKKVVQMMIKSGKKIGSFLEGIKKEVVL